MDHPETDIQFIARMLLSVKEGDQIHGSDAMRLRDLASNGPGPVPHQPQTDLSEAHNNG